MIILAACLLCVVQLQAQLPSKLESQGTIYNVGVIKVHGDATISQQQVDGRVEYLRDNPADTQLVAHVEYKDVFFQGASRKMLLDQTRPLVARELFTSTDSNVVFDLIATSRIDILGTMRHNGLVNPLRSDGLVRFVGQAQQDVGGTGLIPVAEVNNAAGITITGGGGLRFATRLDLQNGNVGNGSADNVVMLPGSWVWRNDDGSMSDEPDARTAYSVRYYGSRPQTSARELSSRPTTIASLVNDNAEGLTLGNDVWVNDSLILGGHIHTEQDDTTRHTIFYTNTYAPLFRSGMEEIDGTLTRTNVVTGSPMVMNNQYTSLKFADDVARGGVRRVELRVKPQTIPEPIAVGADKVRRYFQFEAQNASGVAEADSSFVLEFGYAWRATQVDPGEGAVIETPAPLEPSLDSLALQRLVVDKYATDGASVIPTQRIQGWRYSVASNIRNSGDFAIGLSSSSTVWVLRTKLYLEGAMRQYGEAIQPLMASDLARKKLLPSIPPAIYPYALDPNRANYVVMAMPDSVVDWILVEFKNSASGTDVVHYQTGLLTNTGAIVDPTTFLPLPIRGIKPGNYHVAFRHRNHLAVMTEDPELVAPSNTARELDFASGIGVFGGASAMKLLGTVDGARLFGMAAGDVTFDGKIARDDADSIFQSLDNHGYQYWDTDLDGVVSTRDWNLTWNNRERVSVVP